MKDNQVENGNMANTMDELKELGKQMEQMKDKEEQRKSEPEQFDEE